MGAPRLSVIIPTIDEVAVIAECIRRARQLPDCEVIVVDGGSRDGTWEAAAAADLRVHSDAGRAIQQNKGAQHASADYLLFLHADCWLPPESVEAIADCLLDARVVCGCFRQTIQSRGVRFRLLERGNSLRVRALGWAYGDQGLFFRREEFLAQGGFPETPFLEDWILSRSIRSQGRIALVKDPRIRVDPRRWQRTGVVVQTFRNWTILLAALCGVPAKQLAKFYGKVR